MRGIEIDLRLGDTTELAVTPTHFDMPLNDSVGVKFPIVHVDPPPNQRLAGVLAPQVNRSEREARAEIPGGGDPIVQRNVLEIGAEHEVRSGLESEQPPHERFALTLGGDVVEQAVGAGPGDLERHAPPLLAEFGGPAAGKRLPELFAMISVELTQARQVTPPDLRDDTSMMVA